MTENSACAGAPCALESPCGDTIHTGRTMASERATSTGRASTTAQRETNCSRAFAKCLFWDAKSASPLKRTVGFFEST